MGSQVQAATPWPLCLTYTLLLLHANIEKLSVAIDILLWSTAYYAGVKQHWSWFVLGWVTVVVCQFLLKE